MVSCNRREGRRGTSAFGGPAMNLRQLEIFGAVMSTGTTVGAAHLLHISQPAVSNTINHMEAQLGFPLFHRNRGRLQPTDEAKLLYERTQNVFEAFDSARFIVDQLRGGLIGDLRVVCTPSLGSTLVPLSVARFRTNRPQVKVSIEVGSLDFVFESIEREKADVGVFFLPREHPLTICRQIASLDMICALPRGHPLASKEVVEAADLLEHPFISMNSNEPLGALIEDAFRRAGLEVERAIEVRYVQTARDLVALNQGVALVDPFALLIADRYPDLVFRAFLPKIATSASVIHLEARPLGAIPQLFMNDLREVTKSLDDHEVIKAHGRPIVYGEALSGD